MFTALKKSVKKKIFSKFIIFAILINIAFLGAVFYSAYYTVMQMFYTNSIANLKAINISLGEFAEKNKEILLTVSDDKDFIDYLNTSNEAELKKLFMHITKTNIHIMQLRYLDKNGMEQIRIDRKNFGQPVIFISKDKLQNNSHRDYFKSPKNQIKDSYWYSNLDLNIENHQIEIPYKPTIRIVKPIFHNGEYRGILVMNLLAGHFFEHDVLSMLAYDYRIVNEDGDILLSSFPNESWQASMESFTPDEYKKYMKKHVTGEIAHIHDNMVSVHFNLPTPKKIYIINYFTDEKRILYTIQSIKNQLPLIIVFIILNVLALVFISNGVRKVFTEHEEKIDEQLEELTMKDVQLSQNMKKIAVAEMVENIAHQWKQPLGVISVALSNITVQKEFGTLTDKMIEDGIKASNEQIEYLTHTLDTFKTLNKKVKNKVRKPIQTVINDTVQLTKVLGGVKKFDIEIQMPDSALMFDTYEGELNEALINIINNAKDALIERQIENPQIKIKAGLVTYEDESCMEISIEDNAGGIPKDIIGNVFDQYYTTKGEKGTGLGLNITHKIITDSLGGDLTVENTDIGAKFVIKLPF